MPLTHEQKQNRLRGVGGTEVLAALGKDPRCSPLELYKRKVGEIREPDLAADARVHFGTVLEPVIRQEFARRMNLRVIQRHVTLYHPAAPLLGHIDGWIPAIRSGVEIKTADRFEADEFGEEGSDQVPVRYFVQCCAYMAITNADEWHLAVLVGGNDYRQYKIPRDREIEDLILTGVRRFWTHVEQLEPPDPITPEDVRLRWPRDFGTFAVAPLEVIEACSRLRQLRASLKDLEGQCTAEAVTIQKCMAESSELVDEEGNLLATWRTARGTQRFDAKALAAEFPQLYSQFTREVPGSRRFLLKGDPHP